MRLGVILREWRKSQQLSTRAIAREIGISHATLWRLECGEDVDGVTLIRVLGWLFATAAEEEPGVADRVQAAIDNVLD